MTDVDEAWIAFKNKGEHIAKASVAEKLDVIAAQLNEIQTDTKRTAEIVPKIMGDETAIDEANASADMGGMPPMEGDMGGAPPEDMGAEGEEMTGEELPPEDAMGAEEGAEEMPPAEGEAPMPEEAPGTDAVAEGEPAVEEDEGAEDLIGDVEDEEFEDLDEDDSDVIESLARESRYLWDERKIVARESGKAIDTKMSYPLGLLLIVLIVITIAPALLKM